MTFSPTDDFIDAQRYGALLVQARFTIFQGGVAIGNAYESVSTGTFTIDRNSEFRRTGQLTVEVTPTIPPPLLLPVNPSSVLAPFGTEIYIETGIASAGNTVAVGAAEVAPTQWVPAGLFTIATTTVDDTTLDLTISLELYDRAWVIAQRTLKSPYLFPSTASGNFVAEIKKLLDQAWGQQIGVQPLAYNIVPTSAVVPVASYDQGSDPWQACLDMASAIGYELYFDPMGVVTGHPIPNPGTTPVTWNFSDDATAIQGLPGTGSTALFGDPYSTPVEVSVSMTRDGIFNDIVIQGTGDENAATYAFGIETSGPPILAEAADTNPLSPTFIGGALGDVPQFNASSLITAEGATGTAQSDLYAALSAAWQVTLNIAPNPIFDVDNVITVTRPRVGLYNAMVVLDTITQTINYADTMQLTGRVLSNQPAPPAPTPGESFNQWDDGGDIWDNPSDTWDA
jgi:hypothetical protein